MTLIIPLLQYAYGTQLVKICRCVPKLKTKKSVKSFPLNVFMTKLVGTKSVQTTPSQRIAFM